MGWREHFRPYPQKEQKEQKPPMNPPFATIATIADRGQKLKREEVPPVPPAQDEAEEMYRFEERAAVMEYDGGLGRIEAERLSKSIWCHRRKPPRWVTLAVCEWHKQENDPVCAGCKPESLKWKECLA